MYIFFATEEEWHEIGEAHFFPSEGGISAEDEMREHLDAEERFREVLKRGHHY